MVKTKIGFVGPQGSGKTTTMLEMAAELRKKGVHAGVVSEVVRKAPKHLTINEQTTIESQMWIFGQMIAKELASPDDVIICDRTLLDVIGYTGRISEACATAMRRFASYYLNTFDIIFYLEPKKEYLVDDGVRSTDEAFQKEITKRIEQEIIYFDGTMNIVHEQDHQKRMEMVTDIIKGKEHDQG
jgi:nicotinamide riboside kinase